MVIGFTYQPHSVVSRRVCILTMGYILPTKYFPFYCVVRYFLAFHKVHKSAQTVVRAFWGSTRSTCLNLTPFFTGSCTRLWTFFRVEFHPLWFPLSTFSLQSTQARLVFLAGPNLEKIYSRCWNQTNLEMVMGHLSASALLPANLKILELEVGLEPTELSRRFTKPFLLPLRDSSKIVKY